MKRGVRPLTSMALLAFALAGVGVSACQRRVAVLKEERKDGRAVYGAALAPDQTVPITRVLTAPDAFAKRTVTVEGHVRKACTRKGCWMELGEPGDRSGPGARVTFKNYGFFVPTDAAGAQARVQGSVEVDTLSAAAVRHYEEEGAVFPHKKPDGTAPEVRLVASGVELWRTPPPAQN